MKTNIRFLVMIAVSLLTVLGMARKNLSSYIRKA